MSREANRRPRVFSGIQPSGPPHIGNCLGAMRRWVAEQEPKENFFCVVDMHAITVPRDPAVLRRRIREMAALCFASGLDPYKCTVFVQSHVRAHAECCWILNCVTPVGWLERMTQYKARRGTKQVRVRACSTVRCSRRRTVSSTIPMRCRWAKTKSSTSNSRETSHNASTASTERPLSCPSRRSDEVEPRSAPWMTQPERCQRADRISGTMPYD